MHDRPNPSAGPRVLKPGEPMVLEPDRPWVRPVGDTEPVIDIRHRCAIIAKDNESYPNAREAVWKAEKRRLGGNLWNGIVHTVERLEWDGARLVLQAGRAEYKDLVFKNAIGPATVVKTFSAAALKRHMFVALMPVDADARVLLGRVGPLSTQTRGLLDFIGGSLNVDECDCVSLDSLRRFAETEFEQETGMAAAAGAAKLWTINHDGDCVFFIFKMPADFNAIQRGFRPNRELVELVAIDLAHGSDARHAFSKDVRFVKSYLDSVSL